MPDDDSNDKWWSIFRENTVLAIIVIGVALILLGAGAGWEEHGFQIKEWGWRLFVAIVGVLTASIGIVQTQGISGQKINPKKYGFKILTPETNEEVENVVVMRGTYKKKPVAGFEVRLFIYSLEGRKFWPHGKIVFLNDENWEGIVHGLWEKNNSKQKDIIVVIVGEAGQRLIEYYEDVKEKSSFTGIRNLTPDCFECGRVKVKRKE